MIISANNYYAEKLPLTISVALNQVVLDSKYRPHAPLPNLSLSVTVLLSYEHGQLVVNRME